MLATLAFALALFARCSAKGRGLRVYLEADALSPRDTIMSARLCVALPDSGPRIASVSGRITVDTTFATLVGVSSSPGSPLVARANGDGTVLLAGASAQGLRAGTLLTLRAKLTHPGVLPRIDVRLTELNAPDGESLVTTAVVSGMDARCIGQRVALFEVLPAVASADAGEPLDLRITGCGFDRLKNVVHFGDLTLPNIRSTNDGTHIRVVVPKEYRASAEAAPMQIGAGTYDVIVENGRGPSNARRVTLR